MESSSVHNETKYISFLKLIQGGILNNQNVKDRAFLPKMTGVCVHKVSLQNMAFVILNLINGVTVNTSNEIE